MGLLTKFKGISWRQWAGFLVAWGYIGLPMLLCPSYSLANPEIGSVTAGSATIANAPDNTLQITQHSDRAIINWERFNIAPNEHTQFIQPSSSSIVLNKINPANGISDIQGRLSANGQVWLMNPAGILFGAGAQVNVAGLIATTANIRNEDFMAGNYKFTQSPEWHGAVTNNGLIHITDGGYAALMAPTVHNNGVIKANFGKVALASGNTYTVNFDNDAMINFGANAELAQASISNAGKIIAEVVRC